MMLLKDVRVVMGEHELSGDVDVDEEVDDPKEEKIHKGILTEKLESIGKVEPC